MAPEVPLPRVLVLMATYNGRRWIEEQIASIFAQQGVEIRLVIADDASRDGTADFIRERWGHDPRIQLTQRPKGTGSAGANFRQLFRDAPLEGVDYVALADQDDVWLPAKLQRAIETLTTTGASGYSCAVESFWDDGRTQIQAQSPAITEADFLFEGAGQGCTFVVRCEIFERVQRFAVAHAELTEKLHYHDWLIYLLVRAWGLRWHFDEQALIRYRQHGENEIGSRGSLASIRKRVALIRSGWYRTQIESAIALLGASAAARLPQIQSSFAPQHTPLRAASFALRAGRRRLGDRIVLSVAILAGWV